jgi:hypothetical protein
LPKPDVPMLPGVCDLVILNLGLCTRLVALEKTCSVGGANVRAKDYEPNGAHLAPLRGLSKGDVRMTV